MADIRYRDWLIEAQSYKQTAIAGDPHALLIFHAGGGIREHHVYAPRDVTCDTGTDADAYAVEMAKKWIDVRG